MQALRRVQALASTAAARPVPSLLLAQRAEAIHPHLLRWGRSLSTAGPSSTSSAEGGSTEPTKEDAAEESTAEQPAGEEAAAPNAAEELQAKIADLEEQLSAKHDQVLRALAEADNARRRASLDVENAHKFAVGKFAKSLLDVADNLSRAADAVPEDVRSSDEQPTLKALYEGVVMTETVLLKTFEQHGLVKIWPMDEKFDPNLHDALFEMPDPSKEPGTVGHVTSAGFLLHDRCIRPAGVGIVSKPP